MPVVIQKKETPQGVPTVKTNGGYIDHLKDDKPTTFVAPQAKGVINIEKKTFPDNGPAKIEKIDEEFIVKFGEPIPLYALHNLNVGGKRTLAMENYGGKKFETAQIHASLTVPCHKGNLDAAWEFASDWISDKMQAAVKAATGE